VVPQGLPDVVGCRGSLRQVIQDRWRGRLLGSPLNRKTANADGGPAAWMVLQRIWKQLVAEHERVEGTKAGASRPEPDGTFL